ncbi:MAG: hypothetical protein JNK05_19415 [Myxococcales bacterium]|nr:hypothetical protein [Myxococcales bacterium]
MVSIRSLMGTFGVCAALAGCEPSLMGGDWNSNGRTGQAGAQANSSGNSSWNSPRWAANNPQPQTPPQNPQPNANASTGAQGNVQQGPAPWSANGQNTQPSQNGQVANATVSGQPPVTPQPVSVNGPQAPVCEDTQPRALAMPGESCARPCRAAWQRCFDGCNAGQDRACVAQCDDTFRECMRGCY